MAGRNRSTKHNGKKTTQNTGKCITYWDEMFAVAAFRIMHEAGEPLPASLPLEAPIEPEIVTYPGVRIGCRYDIPKDELRIAVVYSFDCDQRPRVMVPQIWLQNMSVRSGFKGKIRLAAKMVLAMKHASRGEAGKCPGCGKAYKLAGCLRSHIRYECLRNAGFDCFSDLDYAKIVAPSRQAGPTKRTDTADHWKPEAERDILDADDGDDSLGV